MILKLISKHLPLLFGFLLLFVKVDVSAQSFYLGPLFDAHEHLILNSGELISLLKDAGIDGVFLFGPSELTMKQQENDPDFVFPYADVPKNTQKKQVLFDDNTIDYISEQLETGVMWGVGEIPMRHNPDPEGGYPADGPIALQIYGLAAEYGIPVNVHAESIYSDELDRALTYNPETIIIWAHAGDTQPKLLRDMMARNPNLMMDISARNPIFVNRLPIEEQSLTDENGVLKADWNDLFEEFPDRFLFGLDAGTKERNAMIGDLIEYYRSVLGQLTLETAEMIAYKNAEALIGICGDCEDKMDEKSKNTNEQTDNPEFEPPEFTLESFDGPDGDTETVLQNSETNEPDTSETDSSDTDDTSDEPVVQTPSDGGLNTIQYPILKAPGCSLR